MKNNLTKEKMIRGCWRTGKNPTTCNKCGHQNICWELYHKKDEPERNRQKLKISKGSC
jgi:hypothetical protein